MTRGKASRKVPPNATSQTSCQLQDGPMAAMIWRRSAPVLPAIRCSAPAPMFQPSSTTNTVSRKQSRPNHNSTMRRLRGDESGTVQDLASDEIEVEESEDEVEPRHPDQREQHVAGADHVAITVQRAKQSVDEPRLASQFRHHPPGRIGDERKREGQHQHPEER